MHGSKTKCIGKEAPKKEIIDFHIEKPCGTV